MKFYLGTNKNTWLQRASVPLFISHRTLQKIKKRKPAKTSWSLDSGGFTELSMHGEWRTSPEEYAFYVERYRNGYGLMDFASQQDWMCEPFMLAKTGKTVAEHQDLTTQNFLDLKRIAPKLPFIPVIQGQTIVDYMNHVQQFNDAGIDLREYGTVGIGSVCRRQATKEIVEIISELAAYGLRLHGFGMKTLGLSKVGHLMASADSMAWSYGARITNYRRPECTHAAKKCSDCLDYAQEWRNELINKISVC